MNNLFCSRFYKKIKMIDQFLEETENKWMSQWDSVTDIPNKKFEEFFNYFFFKRNVDGNGLFMIHGCEFFNGEGGCFEIQEEFVFKNEKFELFASYEKETPQKYVKIMSLRCPEWIVNMDKLSEKFDMMLVEMI